LKLHRQAGDKTVSQDILKRERGDKVAPALRIIYYNIDPPNELYRFLPEESRKENNED
jgi:hypothetical protein